MRSIAVAIVLGTLGLAAPARAHTSLGLGADYLTDPQAGEMQLTLAVDTPLARHLSLGARFGAMYFGDGQHVGAPIDGRLRVAFRRLYVEGLVGPWLVFGGDHTVRFHGAFGFGLLARHVSFGLEVGYVDPTPMIGVRATFPL